MAAKTKKDSDIAEKLLGVLLATGGGFGATFGMNQLDTRVDAYKKNPMLAPLTNEVIAIGILFTSPKGWSPLAYGMMGASGGDLANDLVNGLSRIEVDSSNNSNDMDAMEEGGYGDSRESSSVDGEHDQTAGDREVRDEDFDLTDSGDGTG